MTRARNVADIIGSAVTSSSTTTLTNKTVNLTSNTLSGTTAQFNTALSDADFATLAGTETLTNKTLTTPVIVSISNSGTVTIPTGTDTLVARATTDTLTNKTLTTPTITLSTTSSTTSGRLSYDSTNKKIQVGDGSNALDYASSTLVTNAQTASYTLVLADKDKLVEVSNASANTVTIPTNASVAYPTGTQINILQTGAGQTTISGTSGVTVNSTGATTASPKLRAQWSTATAIKRGTDSWVVIGDIA